MFERHTVFAHATVRKHGDSSMRTQVWMGEGALTSCSGVFQVDNKFVSSFYYLKSMGVAANAGITVYARQELVGHVPCTLFFIVKLLTNFF